MADLSRLDILVRTQYLSQYIADFGYTIATRMYGGRYCEEDFKKLSLLIMYADVLICNLPSEGTLGHGQIEVVDFTSSLTTLAVGGVSITGSTVSGATNAIFASNIADEINNYTSEPNYTAVANGVYVDIYGPTDGVITLNTTPSPILSVTSNVLGSVAEGTIADVCLDNDELEGIFSHISSLTGLCFVPAGSNYIETPDYVRVYDTLVTSAGDTVVNNAGEIIAAGSTVTGG